MKKITSSRFIKGIVGPDDILNNDNPKFIFIGRSNVGKSSIINCLTANKGLAKTSSTPGRTREINLFLINELIYLLDLPGYGYAKIAKEKRVDIKDLINWFIFLSNYNIEKVFLIIDAKVGPTKDDLEMLRALEENSKEITIILNKIDKLKSSQKMNQVNKIKKIIPDHKIIQFSAKNNIGVQEFLSNIL